MHSVTGEQPYNVSGEVDRYDRLGNDDYTQAGNLFRLMSGEEEGRLQIEHFARADPAYGQGVADALGLAVEVGAK